MACTVLPLLGIALTLLDGGRATETRFEFEEGAMGVPMRMVLYAPDEQSATGASRAAFDRIQALNRVLSDYDAESELRRLCRTATADAPVRVSDDLWNVLVQAEQVARASGGAFDITASPVVNLWRQARALHRLPDPARLAAALEHVGYRHVVLEPETHSVRLALPDMRLDLGGIAKGYAMDAAIEVLRGHGIASALVDAGGDIAVSDPPPGRLGWRIVIAGVEGATPSYALEIANAAVSTSGDRWQYTELEGVRYSHIIDPRTGQALTGRRSVTVVGPRGLLTDGWATALNVLEAERGLPALASEPALAAYCVYRDGDDTRTVESDGWRALVRSGVVRPEPQQPVGQ